MATLHIYCNGKEIVALFISCSCLWSDEMNFFSLSFFFHCALPPLGGIESVSDDNFCNQKIVFPSQRQLDLSRVAVKINLSLWLTFVHSSKALPVGKNFFFRFATINC